MNTPSRHKVITVAQAAEILGVSKSGAYAAIRDNEFPTQVIKIGSRYVIPTKPLLDLLGLDELPADAA